MGGDLRYATNRAGEWRVTVVMNSGDGGWEPSLQLDGSESPVIGYYEARRGGLYLARTDGIDSDCDGQDY